MRAGLPTHGPYLPHKVLPCRQPRSQAEGEKKGLAYLHPVSLLNFSNHVNSLFLGGGLSEARMGLGEEGQDCDAHGGPAIQCETN